MHYTAGMILSVVFQLAHVVPNAEMPLPDKEGNLKHTWAIHQLYTTSNFAPTNKFVSWYTGGLNHQVEHHIFPHISHEQLRFITYILLDLRGVEAQHIKVSTHLILPHTTYIQLSTYIYVFILLSHYFSIL